MALWKSVIVIIFLYIWGCKSQDKVDQHTKIQSAFEGDDVTINCTYQTSYTTPTLFWYQQKVNGIPKYMLNRYSNSGHEDEFEERRFQANLSKTSVPLTIKNLCVSDSAVYYCALKPTVTQTHSTLTQKLSQCNSIRDEVTLSCKYDGSVNNLHWYRQYPGSKPEFLAYIYPHGTPSDPLPPRLLPKVDKNNNLVSLKISSAEVPDSALTAH
ncbi:uncharacterized protein LOC125251941 [Megalobrama amblycephala]|uniref:uncharacterized protein LOC125251941 n=1 Tax=Megalobrama amblycephala TaxID=75352 RepID=UPI0020144DE6|nr:uncharacterized protein LOC125251941 [Megalobrama amblycephala]